MTSSLKALLFISLIALHRSPSAHARPADSLESNGKPVGSPKLVLVLVIDQFRADYLTRFYDRFLPATQDNGSLGGFRYLLSRGAYYPFAQYELAICETCPGHAIIASGAWPYQNGIPINNWWDPEKEQSVGCVQDPKASLVIQNPSGKIGDGVSPLHLNGTTFGDELKNANTASRVISIAIKSTASILLGGKRADLAIWLDRNSPQWISSDYYLPEKKLPAWVTELNTDLSTGLAQGAAPRSMLPPSNQTPPPGGKRTVASIAESPRGLLETELAAKKALSALKLGQQNNTDLLALSFSSHDIVGHNLGPYSPEMEAMTLSEDQTLSNLFNFIQSTLPGGMNDVAIVLTADHGIPPLPEWANANRIESGRIDENQIIGTVSKKLEKKYGKLLGEKWFSYAFVFNFFLNKKEISKRKIDFNQIQADVKEILLTIPGIENVVTRAEFEKGNLPNGLLGRQIRNTFYRSRVGDVLVIPKPYFVYSEDGWKGTDHMTGYSYDRTVPIVIAGPGVKPGKYATQAFVTDIAPTLSFITNTLPPVLSEGRVLSEIFK